MKLPGGAASSGFFFHLEVAATGFHLCLEKFTADFLVLLPEFKKKKITIANIATIISSSAGISIPCVEFETFYMRLIYRGR